MKSTGTVPISSFFIRRLERLTYLPIFHPKRNDRNTRGYFRTHWNIIAEVEDARDCTLNECRSRAPPRSHLIKRGARGRPVSPQLPLPQFTGILSLTCINASLHLCLPQFHMCMKVMDMSFSFCRIGGCFYLRLAIRSRLPLACAVVCAYTSSLFGLLANVNIASVNLLLQHISFIDPLFYNLLGRAELLAIL